MVKSSTIPLRLILRAGSLLAIIAIPGALYGRSRPIVGHWRFQTATGSTTVNGASIDLIGNGVLDITDDKRGITATISWLNALGQITSTRTMQGQAGPEGVVFRHDGKRTRTGRNGSDVSVDVSVRWTLRAKGSALTGERLVETDEDEPKPVTGIRIRKRVYLAAPSGGGAVSNEVERGPSTAAERARVIQIALDAQNDPLKSEKRDGAWFRAWVNEVPDLTLNPNPLDGWLKFAPAPAARAALGFQYLASVMALQIQHPELADQLLASDQAGLEGVLRAYETLLRTDGLYRSRKLDLALEAREQNRLPTFLGMLSGRDVPLAAATSTATDPTVRRIVALGTGDPRAMDWLDILSNRFGGRMAGSDAYTHAAQWTLTQLQEWGVPTELEEAGQMSAGFNRGPWSARMLAPSEEALRIATPAYTAGTKGVQQGLATLGPVTVEDAQARFAQFKGKWVLVGGENGGSGRDGETVFKTRRITRLLIEAGALGTIQSGEEPLYSGTAAATRWESLPTMPDIKLAAVQYDEIRRRLASGAPVTLEFDIRNWFYPGPVRYHNVVAQIRGSDKPDEIVLIGAHLDSFDGATGAADNGSGVAIMIEAMRLLAQSGARPRRTIMMVAFGAEELGRRGAFAFAERHADQLENVVVMLNCDGTPGAISGITVPSTWQTVLSQVEKDLDGVNPFFDFALTIDNQPRDAGKAMNASSGSDDAVFAAQGIPTPKFSVLSDFDYSRALHTVADTYEAVLPFRSAQQFSSIAIALTAYEVANAPEIASRSGYYRTAVPTQ
jgi:carboxypeptidase Q